MENIGKENCFYGTHTCKVADGKDDLKNIAEGSSYENFTEKSSNQKAAKEIFDRNHSDRSVDEKNLDSLPSPWILKESKGNGKKSTVFSNPETGQLFYTRQNLDRYVAYAKKAKLPAEVKWEVPDLHVSSSEDDQGPCTQSNKRRKRKAPPKKRGQSKTRPEKKWRASRKQVGQIRIKAEGDTSGHRHSVKQPEGNESKDAASAPGH